MLTPRAIGQAIKSMREQVGLSQNELGRRLNGSGNLTVTVRPEFRSGTKRVSKTGLVYNWETGSQFPSLNQLIQVARVLDIDLSDLIIEAENLLLDQ